METTNTLYTPEEQALLDLTRSKRKSIIEDMTKNGTPGYKEVEVLNQVMASLDKSIHDGVSNRVKLQDNNNKEEILRTVAETLRQMKLDRAKAKQAEYETDTELSDEYLPTDIVKGELEMEQKQFSIEELEKEVGE